MSRSSPAPWFRLIPEGLAGRFALLLLTALLAVNLVALALLSSERQRIGREISESRELHRLVSVVPLIEAVPPAERERIARLASDRFARISLGPEPLVGTEQADVGLGGQAGRMLAEFGLEPDELRLAILNRSGQDVAGWRGHADLALSVLLPEAPEATLDRWLNVAARSLPPPARAGPLSLLLTLFVSLAAVLGVGLLFVRRLTQPLAALAGAARAAGRGDRGARVPEQGARELRQAAHAFNEMQAQIARFDAERTRTLAAVGHDLRTPITSLRIRAEMLEEADREPIVRTLDDMAVMADGLVAYARGQGDAEAVAPVDLSELLSRLCAERGAAFVPRLTVVVHGRPVALGRAFGNLIDNAIRYGGAARVRLDCRDGGAVVAIEDEGPGIPPERTETMFEPFVRGEASRNLETGGAGLGLAIARAVIRAHGGDVELKNRSRGGLVASVIIPGAKAEGS